ncbi:hypothetical protein HYFRA_00012302 [Hymenoscyphus fraxineus]|uniref:Uncharacterized protein n=1 Tax=Hymenoscyphus fraxineus TaxID=746836 RepID=A0A9N9L4G4_9HELO|nr:hypothetical protein HYFRA_00012302 [Hymenoscyphus fraxineus]
MGSIESQGGPSNWHSPEKVEQPSTKPGVRAIQYNCYYIGGPTDSHREGFHCGWIKHDFRTEVLSQLRDSIRLQLRLSHYGLRVRFIVLLYEGESQVRCLMDDDFEDEVFRRLQDETKTSIFVVGVEREETLPSLENQSLPSYITDLIPEAPEAQSSPPNPTRSTIPTSPILSASPIRWKDTIHSTPSTRRRSPASPSRSKSHLASCPPINLATPENIESLIALQNLYKYGSRTAPSDNQTSTPSPEDSPVYKYLQSVLKAAEGSVSDDQNAMSSPPDLEEMTQLSGLHETSNGQPSSGNPVTNS